MADNCFDNIVGFTRTECDCFDTEALGEDYDKSLSGLYMDELPESEYILRAVQNIATNCKSMGELFRRARDGAIRDFREKFFTEVGTLHKVKKEPYGGLIGQNGFTSALALTTDYAGAVYEMQAISGGVLKISELYLSINQTRTVNVEVYKAYAIDNEYALQELITTIEVNAVANTATAVTLDEPLELPLYDESAHVVHYLFIYNRSAGFQPMDNKVLCPTCSGIQTKLSAWAAQGSITGNDKDHLRTADKKTGSTAHANGITVEALISCNDLGFLCKNYTDYPDTRIAIQYAILYQAVSNLLKSILRSGDVSRFALVGRERMEADAAILHNKFISRIPWIAQNIKMGTNSCFQCGAEESSTPYKTGIRF